MEKTIDCIISGSCVVDLLVRPVSLETPIGGGRLFDVEPIDATTGGIVCNAGIALARLGMRAAALSYVGNDSWATIVREKLQAEKVDTRGLQTLAGGTTSTTAVLIDPSGERSFAHCVGAPRQMNKQFFLDNMPLLSQSRMMLLGYYFLMPNLEPDLPEVMAALRAVGCQTAMDSAGTGSGMQPLDRILPHLDVYVPSLAEAVFQTGERDPKRIVEIFRACGAPGVLGVKLGSDGALLSPATGKYIDIACVTPPSPIRDTTGAGDSFYAGLLTGLLRGMDLAAAGRLAAATGACCVTGFGATAGLRDYETTRRLAGIQ